jgi:hypothetical protein
MGKRARLVCAKLRQHFGSPGASLKLPYKEEWAQWQRQVLLAPQAGLQLQPSSPVAEPWKQSLRRLVLTQVQLDAPGFQAVSEGLPALQELTCSTFNPMTSIATIPPHTALTSLTAGVSSEFLQFIATIAPRLQSLHVPHILRGHSISSSASSANALSALASFPSLRCLDVTIIPSLLPSFASTLQHLTALTHLGLDITDYPGEACSPEASLQCTHALAGLRHLDSVKLFGFSALGPPLVPVLLALSLTRLELGEWFRGWDGYGALPDLNGCFPDISTMPLLQHLALYGEYVITPEHLQQLCSAGSVSLRALELRGMQFGDVPAVCHLLVKPLTALTLLGLKTDKCRSDHSEHAGYISPQNAELLSIALSCHPQLQDLQICADMDSYAPFVAKLPALTLLKLRHHLRRTRMDDGDLRAIGKLTNLRALILSGDFGFGDDDDCSFEEDEECCDAAHDDRCRRCLETATSLPLLEVLKIRQAWWSEENWHLLVPPPARLKCVELLGEQRHGTYYTPDAESAMARLESYGVEVLY